VHAIVDFQENGLRFGADVLTGQKTGWFLDQRENRRKVAELAEGRSVLDVFCAHGGFSAHALAGGATSVHAVDISPQAIAVTRRHAPEARTSTGDAFEVMGDEVARHRRYGVVIVDPPSFARRAADRERAVRAYRRLTSLAVALVEPGGWLVQSSCSSHVPAADFSVAVMSELSAARRRIVRSFETGHALDHPIGFPEGAYLKTVFAQLA
jgi:23S rRNA (cytosine1962-C5)-methyltransferase